MCTPCVVDFFIPLADESASLTTSSDAKELQSSELHVPTPTTSTATSQSAQPISNVQTDVVLVADVPPAAPIASTVLPLMTPLAIATVDTRPKEPYATRSIVHNAQPRIQRTFNGAPRSNRLLMAPELYKCLRDHQLSKYTSALCKYDDAAILAMDETGLIRDIGMNKIEAQRWAQALVQLRTTIRPLRIETSNVAMHNNVFMPNNNAPVGMPTVTSK
jgi:hypothetical protein